MNFNIFPDLCPFLLNLQKILRFTLMDSTKNSAYLLTIIVPLYNEEGNLRRLARELSDYINQSSYKANVLFVNDGSNDNSAKMIENLCIEFQSFNYIHLKKNSGLSTALKAGIDQVGTKYSGYIDADLQTSPFDFDLLMSLADGAELVTGIRDKRKDNYLKLISSKIANAIRQAVTHDGISDTGCPLKVFKTETVKQIPFFNGMHRFLPALVKLQGGIVKQVPVRHFERIAGISKYHLFNRLLGPAIDLIAFTWMRKRYIRYEISGRG